MSTLNVETNYNTTIISSKLTGNYEEMMNELGDKNHCLFGLLCICHINNSKYLKLSSKYVIAPLSASEIVDLCDNGHDPHFYEKNRVYCYLCVDDDLNNYMFSPEEAENRDNNYQRLRGGVCYFAEKGFNIYLMR